METKKAIIDKGAKVNHLSNCSGVVMIMLADQVDNKNEYYPDRYCKNWSYNGA